MPKFIDTIIAEVMSAEDKEKFIQDLNGMMAECMENFDQSFEKCTDAQQKELLDKHEAANPFQYPKIWGTQMLPSPDKNFFGKLKDMVAWAYFSTEFAGETLLAYDPVPGKLESCIPLEEVGKAWSLN